MSASEGEQGNEIFGSLPRRRPGIESPRRARARDGEQRKPATEATARSPEPPAQGPNELEQLALAGVKLAGGVTAVGLRLAGRAVGGLGRVVGRR